MFRKVDITKLIVTFFIAVAAATVIFFAVYSNSPEDEPEVPHTGAEASDTVDDEVDDATEDVEEDPNK